MTRLEKDNNVTQLRLAVERDIEDKVTRGRYGSRADYFIKLFMSIGTRQDDIIGFANGELLEYPVENQELAYVPHYRNH